VSDTPTTAGLLAQYRRELTDAFGNDVPPGVVDAVLLSGADALHRGGIRLADADLTVEPETTTPFPIVSDADEYTAEEAARLVAERRAMREAELARVGGGEG
jgi:hypothetical protein